jgi:hypothetical protein
LEVIIILNLKTGNVIIKKMHLYLYIGNILASNTCKFLSYGWQNQKFGLMNIWTNGYSDQWIFGPMNIWTNEYSDKWILGLMRSPRMYYVV